MERHTFRLSKYRAENIHNRRIKYLQNKSTGLVGNMNMSKQQKIVFLAVIWRIKWMTLLRIRTHNINRLDRCNVSDVAALAFLICASKVKLNNRCWYKGLFADAARTHNKQLQN